MALWDYCAVCGERIENSEPCIGLKECSEHLCGDSICLNCAKIENLPGGKKPISITDLLARAEAAEARVHELETTHRVEMCEDGYDCVELGKVRRKLEEAEAENKKLLDAMLHIRKTENLERCKVIYEMDFADALDHEIVSNIASMVFRGLMEADIKRRGKKEE